MIHYATCYELDLVSNVADFSGEASLALPINLTSLSCREDFFEQNFTCLPRCDVWGQEQHKVSQALRIVRIATATIMLLSSVVLIVVFLIRHRIVLVEKPLVYPF